MIPRTITAGCVSCRRSQVPLFRWKVRFLGELEFLWLCEACRNLPGEQLIRQIEWNTATKPILEDEAPFAPSVKEAGDHACG